jgi:hypothetical protein
MDDDRGVPSPTPAPRWYEKTKVPAEATGHRISDWDDITPPELFAVWAHQDPPPATVAHADDGASEGPAPDVAAPEEGWWSGPDFTVTASTGSEDLDQNEDEDGDEWWYSVDLTQEELASLLAEADQDESDNLT